MSMSVLVDTCVWSLALRGKTPRNQEIARLLAELIESGQAHMMGSIRQELLSGYSDPQRFEKLKEKMSYFPNLPVLDVDYISAAEYSNTCRRNGVQGAHVDFLICAVAVRLGFAIFTVDKDFGHYQRYIPIELVGVESLKNEKPPEGGS